MPRQGLEPRDMVGVAPLLLSSFAYLGVDAQLEKAAHAYLLWNSTVAGPKHNLFRKINSKDIVLKHKKSRLEANNSKTEITCNKNNLYGPSAVCQVEGSAGLRESEREGEREAIIYDLFFDYSGKNIFHYQST